jgi:hypothetical protein
LRIDIDNQDFLADCRERGGKIDGGGGLADTALLVGDGDDPVLRNGASKGVRGQLRLERLLISRMTEPSCSQALDVLPDQSPKVTRRSHFINIIQPFVKPHFNIWIIIRKRGA